MGIEPTTIGLKGQRSTIWAKKAVAVIQSCYDFKVDIEWGGEFVSCKVWEVGVDRLGASSLLDRTSVGKVPGLNPPSLGPIV